MTCSVHVFEYAIQDSSFEISSQHFFDFIEMFWFFGKFESLLKIDYFAEKLYTGIFLHRLTETKKNVFDWKNDEKRHLIGQR